jgi:hypothetical protein
LKKIVLVAACFLVALSAGATARATVTFGVNEDGGKIGNGDGFFATLADLGMTENRVSIPWDARTPQAIPNQASLDLWVPEAAIRGIHVVFAVTPAHPRDLTATRTAPVRFANFLQLLARTYPTVKDFVVGNEPNLNRFWQPQFSAKGKHLSPAAYERVLALSYDALKAVSKNITVIGLGLSPRGNDFYRAVSDPSLSPVRFLHDLGVAYRASHRKLPIMDVLGFHPYPNSNTDPPLKGYPWPKAGLPNLDRIKQAVWDAFNGTKQPTFAEPGVRTRTKPLLLDLDETGWQAAIPLSLESFYYGQENVIPVNDLTQAQYYADTIRFVSCDSTVRSFSFFHLYDEPNLDRWQSGLIRADGSKRPSYDAVKKAIADTGGRCAVPPIAWRHKTTVVGASLKLGYLGSRPATLVARSQEDALLRAGLFRVGASRLSSAARRTIARSLANARSRPLAAVNVLVSANKKKTVRLPRATLRSGWYVAAVRLGAWANPTQRANVWFSTAFRVGAGATRR